MSHTQPGGVCNATSLAETVSVDCWSGIRRGHLEERSVTL